MRSCLLSFLLVILVAANGYAIWQVHLLRADVTELKATLLRADEPDADTLAAHARSALRAFERGQIGKAQEELERIGELIEGARTTAGEQGERLARRLAEAKEAVAARSAEASERIRELLREITRVPAGKGAASEDAPAEP